MLTDVRMAFDHMVNELEWMDASTRARAHRKLHAMRPFVGFPEWITKPEKLDEYYKGVHFLVSFKYNHLIIFKISCKIHLVKKKCLNKIDQHF